MGFVSLVGAGIGNADLLTRKAEKCLKRADIILHDRLVSEDILALIPRGTPRIFAGKSCKLHYMTQTETNQVMVELAKEGKWVVRLKGGDPFIFGRGGEEAQALCHAQVPFEIVPGITAASAAGAYTGIPLTHRNYSQNVLMMTGHMQKESPDNFNWPALAHHHTTLVVYMGLANATFLQSNLLQHGRSTNTPVAIIENASLANQRKAITTLNNLCRTIHEQNFTSPTLLIIGEVVSLSEQLDWFTHAVAPEISDKPGSQQLRTKHHR